jgi:hypothetical protein
MSKTTAEVWCASCDSEFKVYYSPDNTSGLHKFCTFCGSVLEPEDDNDNDVDNDEDNDD